MRSRPSLLALARVARASGRAPSEYLDDDLAEAGFDRPLTAWERYCVDEVCAFVLVDEEAESQPAGAPDMTSFLDGGPLASLPIRKPDVTTLRLIASDGPA